jgi:hypothetical protein
VGAPGLKFCGGPFEIFFVCNSKKLCPSSAEIFHLCGSDDHFLLIPFSGICEPFWTDKGIFPPVQVMTIFCLFSIFSSTCPFILLKKLYINICAGPLQTWEPWLIWPTLKSDAAVCCKSKGSRHFFKLNLKI